MARQAASVLTISRLAASLTSAVFIFSQAKLIDNFRQASKGALPEDAFPIGTNVHRLRATGPNRSLGIARDVGADDRRIQTGRGSAIGGDARGAADAELPGGGEPLPGWLGGQPPLKVRD